MHRALVVISLLLAGCISTPQELRDQGERTVFELKQLPDAAAACVARNIENARHYQTTIRPLDDKRELVMRSQVHNLAVIEFEPMKNGSRATIWMRSIFHDREGFQQTIMRNC
jgi:hypothetical protein